MALGDDKKSGVSGGVTAVTSTVGNGVGGLLGTVGGVVGAAGRGGEFNLVIPHNRKRLSIFSRQHRDRSHWSNRQTGR